MPIRVKNYGANFHNGIRATLFCHTQQIPDGLIKILFAQSFKIIIPRRHRKIRLTANRAHHPKRAIRLSREDILLGKRDFLLPRQGTATHSNET